MVMRADHKFVCMSGLLWPPGLRVVKICASAVDASRGEVATGWPSLDFPPKGKRERQRVRVSATAPAWMRIRAGIRDFAPEPTRDLNNNDSDSVSASDSDSDSDSDSLSFSESPPIILPVRVYPLEYRHESQRER